MQVNLSLDHDNVNHKLHKKLWAEAVRAKGFDFSSVDNADVIIQWGVTHQNRIPCKKLVLVLDFPYWNRRERNTDEYYKVSLNGQHPTPYIMNESHDSSRYYATGGAEIKPWKDGGGYILVAGMGVKAANQNGYEVGEWEEKIIAIIKKQTDKEIIYRPKPNRKTPPINGTIYDDGKTTIDEAVAGAYCVVCHHGNPTISALQEGIPIFMNGAIGAASHCASFDFNQIHNHKKPDNREQLLYNLAHWQFSIDEIKSGAVFDSFISRGFI
jgi:hypothetical protein